LIAQGQKAGLMSCFCFFLSLKKNILGVEDE
jgi:hypothetical protein